MKNILFVALLAGASAFEAAPAIAATTQGQEPVATKKEVKRQRKMRKQTGPEVYKGTVAEQSRIVTDAPGAEKEDSDSPKRERKAKKN